MFCTVDRRRGARLIVSSSALVAFTVSACGDTTTSPDTGPEAPNVSESEQMGDATSAPFYWYQGQKIEPPHRYPGPPHCF